MSYLSKFPTLENAADDFNCGWSIFPLLAKLGARDKDEADPADTDKFRVLPHPRHA